MTEKRHSQTEAGHDAPLVSIVMPTYNRAHLLSKALDACLVQTYANIEIIVVDDGSVDDTMQVLRRYTELDPRVRAFSKANGGIADTLNFGFARAQGNYLTWTSDDNVYHPCAIEKMVFFLKTNPDIAFVYTDMNGVDFGGKLLGVMHASEPAEIQGYGFLSGCFLYTRTVMNEIGEYDSRWTRCQDRDFWIRVSTKFRMVRIPEVFYDYLVHDESMSGNHIEHISEHTKLLLSYAKSPSERFLIKSRGRNELARHAERSGHAWKALWHYLFASLFNLTFFPKFWKKLWQTIYNIMPDFVHHMWRRAKNYGDRRPISTKKKSE